MEQDVLAVGLRGLAQAGPDAPWERELGGRVSAQLHEIHVDASEADSKDDGGLSLCVIPPEVLDLR